MQTSTNALAVMGVNITVTTQLSHTTALAIVDGLYQAMAEPAKVDKIIKALQHLPLDIILKQSCSDH